MNVALRRVVFVAQAQHQRQPRNDLERVLPVKVIRRRADSIHRVRCWVIVVRKSPHKVGQACSRERSGSRSISVQAEIVASICIEVVIEVVLDAMEIETEFPLMAPVGDGDVILRLINHVVKFGWALRRGTNVETRGVHDGRRDTGGIVRIDVGEAELGGRGVVVRSGLQRGSAIGGAAEFVDPAGSKAVRVSEAEDLVAGNPWRSRSQQGRLPPLDAPLPMMKGNASRTSSIKVDAGENVARGEVVVGAENALVFVDGAGGAELVAVVGAIGKRKIFIDVIRGDGIYGNLVVRIGIAGDGIVGAGCRSGLGTVAGYRQKPRTATAGEGQSSPKLPVRSAELSTVSCGEA